ncbi:hypothetical protein [Acinetobacter sp. F-1]|uniref:hypothetical protein n=1 Tax=Acinetobacter sp. F-1 TaxID=1796981 RepID=UPI001FD57ADF|nr:hypothetical protein [Acinetobacter sp. F-1]
MKLDVSSCTLSSFFKFGLMLGGMGILQACDQQQVKPEQESQATSEEGVKISAANTKADVVTVSAKSLTQVAGQATLPAEADLNPATVPEDAKAFIGRYHTEIDCDGRFAPCTEGKAEFILTLMPDGTVHRSILQYGKVFIDNTKNSTAHNITYRKDRWFINPERTEVVVSRKEGASFYYTIKDSNHLVMNLDKIYSEKERINRELFDRGYPAPSKAYELVKDTTFDIRK